MINHNFLLRTFSTLALVPVVLFIVWAGGVLYDFCVTLLILGCFSEWIGLTHPTVRGRVRVIGYLGLFTSLFFVPLWGIGISLLLSLITWQAVLLSAGRFPDEDKKAHYTKALWLSVGIPYLAWSGIALVDMNAGRSGFALILNLLFIVWATDIGAYLVGSTVGGPKIWPQISPKKTWAGLLGGIVSAALVGYSLLFFFEMGTGPVLGGLFAIVAQAGDFFESYLKRRAGVKDSGRLIPGHGGLLDRVDGLLSVALLIFVWMIL
ncbi:MAG: phosphatidate cytidylyltransferase [Bdellovibrionales bacterium]